MSEWRRCSGYQRAPHRMPAAAFSIGAGDRCKTCEAARTAAWRVKKIEADLTYHARERERLAALRRQRAQPAVAAPFRRRRAVEAPIAPSGHPPVGLRAPDPAVWPDEPLDRPRTLRERLRARWTAREGVSPIANR